ncbi:glycosyltransferase [Acidicapsa acidisoli]|uniref:glycosyltransferase n=1 Tax=Acidicapsa acidisoli TaxID=1615681 RepID=UPI0021E0290A|nr:glycosyltransferase [Acidicapsa acidisoli]
MTPRIKLMLLIPHLGGGGAERVTHLLTRHLSQARFEIDLILFTKDRSLVGPVPTQIRVTRFEVKRVRHAWLQLVRLIRARQPDVILSGMAHLNFLVLLLKPLLPRRTVILVRQNTTASSSARTWLARQPYRHLYRRADAIICQSEAMANDLAINFCLPRTKLAVLANPVDLDAHPTEDDSHHGNWPPDTWPRILAVGRLSKEKGLDMLLQARHVVRQRYPQAHLQILGAGPEEEALRQLTGSLNLEAAVTFAGHRNPAQYYASATLFVLPSRYEGMPNAMLEAAAAGLPIIATPCSDGVSDLLRDAPGTWLTSSISANSLAETIVASLPELAHPPATPRRFRHAFLAPFELDTAIAAYAAFIEQAAARKKT